MELSPLQSKALDAVHKWYKDLKTGGLNDKPYLYIGGYAGTGKTTLAKHFAAGLSGVAYAAYTGKAALQLQRAGCYPTSTIHSLIYRPIVEGDDSKQSLSFELNEESELRHKSLLILDECSMVNDELRDDLLSFRVPILVLGDPGQLPPIKGSGAFTSNKPDVMLTEVHRQALESPIIRIATDVRSGKSLGRYKDSDVSIYPLSGEIPGTEDYDQVLCGKNSTRLSTNRAIRSKLGLTGVYPQVGDRVICLRNNRVTRVFNGLIGRVTRIGEIDDWRVCFSMVTEEGVTLDVQTHEICWSNPEALEELPWYERKRLDEFTFGFAITTHKSQGSQWDSVYVKDDGMFSWDPGNRKKWLYTAVTRAAKRLAVVRSK